MGTCRQTSNVAIATTKTGMLIASLTAQTVYSWFAWIQPLLPSLQEGLSTLSRSRRSSTSQQGLLCQPHTAPPLTVVSASNLHAHTA